MPLFMDRHLVPGVEAPAAADAHAKDLEIQDKYGVKYLTYWMDEGRGRVFCLADAPSEEALIQVHREAHGLIPHEVIEVQRPVLEAFLGALQTVGPAPGKLLWEPTAPQVETPFRAILFTDITGSTALTRSVGDAKAMELLRTHNGIIRDVLRDKGGNEVKHTGDGFMASFASVSGAVECGMAILRGFDAHNANNPADPIHVHVGLSAGEPVEEDHDLFGSAVQLAARLCSRAKTDQILVSSAVHELCLGKKLPFKDFGRRRFKGFDQPVRVYEVAWSEASYNLPLT